MNLKYISQIQTNLKKYKTIYTNRTTNRIMDGSYVSVYKGRSMNFDELREYVPGDEIRDIDWKATARSQKVLIREYIAEKKHNILFLMDTNKRMMADTGSGEEKRQVALLCAGTLAFLVNRNNDYIGAMFQNGEAMQNYPLKTGLMNIEQILSGYDHSVTLSNKTNLNRAMEYIIKHIRRRMILVIVTDMEGLREITEANLRRLKVMNDILIICVGDAEMDGNSVYDVESSRYLPEYLTKDKRLVKRMQEKRIKIQEECRNKIKKYGIAMVKIEKKSDIDSKIVELLEKHKLEMK